jgi:hypothetical protein
MIYFPDQQFGPSMIQLEGIHFVKTKTLKRKVSKEVTVKQAEQRTQPLVKRDIVGAHETRYRIQNCVPRGSASLALTE